MSAGFHRLGTNVVGKVTGYNHLSLPVGVIVNGMPVLPMVPMPASTAPALADTLLAGEHEGPSIITQQRFDKKAARESGYTGDSCSTCNSTRMKRNGSCLVCEACGTTTGCS